MRKRVLAITLIVSLAGNAVLFVGGVVHDFIDLAVDGVLGLTTAAATQHRALAALNAKSAKQAKTLAASRAVVARQRGMLSTRNGTVARLTRQVEKGKDLSARQQKKLADLKRAWSQRGRELNNLNTALARQGREAAKIRMAVRPVVKRSRARLLRGATRSALSVPAEAVPYLGVLAIVGFTAWEIRDYCATVRDMDEIQRAVAGGGPQNDSADCEEQVRRSLQEQWAEWKKRIPDLPNRFRRLWPFSDP